TLNSGRLLINMVPKSARSLDAAGVIRRLQPPLAGVDGITVYMQPVQDLTIDAADARIDGQILHRLHVHGDAVHARKGRLQAADHPGGVEAARALRHHVDEEPAAVERGVDAVHADERGDALDR